MLNISLKGFKRLFSTKINKTPIEKCNYAIGYGVPLSNKIINNLVKTYPIWATGKYYNSLYNKNAKRNLLVPINPISSGVCFIEPVTIILLPTPLFWNEYHYFNAYDLDLEGQIIGPFFNRNIKNPNIHSHLLNFPPKLKYKTKNAKHLHSFLHNFNDPYLSFDQYNDQFYNDDQYHQDLHKDPSYKSESSVDIYNNAFISWLHYINKNDLTNSKPSDLYGVYIQHLPHQP